MLQKIVCLTMLCLAGLTNLHAQLGTIQVSVTDTIIVPADQITVMVSFKDTTKIDFSAPRYDIDEEIEEPAEGEEPSDTPAEPYNPFANLKTDFTADREAVIRILDEHKVSWKNPADQFSFLKGPMAGMNPGGAAPKNEEIMIDFSTKSQMDEVMTKIKENPFVNTMEMGASVDKQLLDKTRLYEKLLKKSKIKAESIAKLAGKKVGGVHKIGSEFDGFTLDKYMDSLTGAGGMFGGIFKMLGGMFNEKTPDYKVTVSETMTVTYYLLDK